MEIPSGRGDIINARYFLPGLELARVLQWKKPEHQKRKTSPNLHHFQALRNGGLAN